MIDRWLRRLCARLNKRFYDKKIVVLVHGISMSELNLTELIVEPKWRYYSIQFWAKRSEPAYIADLKITKE